MRKKVKWVLSRTLRQQEVAPLSIEVPFLDWKDQLSWKTTLHGSIMEVRKVTCRTNVSIDCSFACEQICSPLESVVCRVLHVSEYFVSPLLLSLWTIMPYLKALCTQG